MSKLESFINHLLINNTDIKKHLLKAHEAEREGCYPALVEETGKIIRLMEEGTLVARDLPYIEQLNNADDMVNAIVQDSFDCRLGYTPEGCFALEIPRLLPKKEQGSTAYIRDTLYKCLKEFFRTEMPHRFNKVVLIYKYTYERNNPKVRMRDHDNIECNMVTDVLNTFFLQDDDPKFCEHHFLSDFGDISRTTVFIVPEEQFPSFYKNLKNGKIDMENLSAEYPFKI